MNCPSCNHSPHSGDCMVWGCRCAGSPPPLADWADVVADALHRAVAVIVLSWAVTAAAVYGWMAING